MKDFLLRIEEIKHFLPKLSSIFIPLFFLIAFVEITVLNVYTQKKIAQESILPAPFTDISYTSYPLIKDKFIPDLSAKAAIAVDDDSKVILFSKNPEFRFAPASTTKIMTALTSLQFFNLRDTLTVRVATSEGSIIGLKKNQKIRFEDLLYAMMLPSANDAALAIAQNYPGGENAFLNKMNENAKRLHLFSTHFSDPAGLMDDKGYTTVLDLARLASAALKNETFAQVVATKHKVISDSGGQNEYSVNNLNKLLGFDGVNGIKTGYTDEAGQVLVTSKIEKGHTIIIVVMKSADRFGDTQKLLQLVSNNITYLSTHP